jgi:hypothetical protein
MFHRLFWNRIVFEAEGTGTGTGAAAGAGGASAGASAAAGGGAASSGGAAPPPVAFAEQLPEDIRGEAAFRDIKDLGGLAKGFLNAQKLLGVPADQLLRLPGAADDTAAWDGVYAKLGRPEKADAYAFSEVKLPDGMSIDDGLKKGYQDIAHKAGLSTKQADELYKWWNGTMGERFAASQGQTQQQMAAAETALRTEWGQAFDQNVALGRQAVQHYGGEKLLAELEATGLGNHPELAKVFARMGKDLQEDGVIGAGGGGTGINSPGEARQQISALQKDTTFTKAYTDKRDPGHADAVARMAALYTQAYPQT